MTGNNKTVVHVETLDEYQAVLETWFKKGYNWYKNTGEQKFNEYYFTFYNARYLLLDGEDIYRSAWLYPESRTGTVSFKEFMAKERGKVTYEVSTEQMAFIKEANENLYPASYLMVHNEKYEYMFSDAEYYGATFERDLLRYLGGDDSVVFKLNNPLYLLKGKDSDGDTVYFTLDGLGAPTYVYDDEKSDAFKAPRDEIVRWYTPFWKIEQADA